MSLKVVLALVTLFSWSIAFQVNKVSSLVASFGGQYYGALDSIFIGVIVVAVGATLYFAREIRA